MRWRRISVRTLMIIVAIVSLGLAVASREMLARRKSHLEYVTIFARQLAHERQNLVDFESFRRTGVVNNTAMDMNKWEEVARRRVVYYAEMEAAFRLAADQPWRPEPVIPGDPAEQLAWEAAFDLEAPKLELDRISSVLRALSEPPKAQATVPELNDPIRPER